MDGENAGYIFNIQRFSTFDGPGVRTVVFLKGCPLRCLWCHNPEGLNGETQILYDPKKCFLCGACAAVCPNGLHRVGQTAHDFDRTACVSCGKCASVCTGGALQTAGQKMTVPDVLSRVLADKRYYGDKGGITLSGGEPLLQWRFSLALLRASHEAGITTCLETSGFASSEVFDRVTAQVDTLLLDYKATGDRHRELTGVGQEEILRNLASADRRGIVTVLRCPVVPGANDDLSHWDAVASLASAHACVGEIHLEPYHRIGIGKSLQLGCEQSVFDVPTAERMAEILSYVQARTEKHVRIS